VEDAPDVLDGDTGEAPGILIEGWMRLYLKKVR
jgi:hypothetical protein